MRLLLDTHVLLWVFDGSPRLGRATRGVITDPRNTVYVSVVSLWEIAVKARIGKLRIDLTRLIELLAPSNFLLLDLRPSHLMHLLQLPVFSDHRDPFDHLLIAQAQAEALVFVSSEAAARRYPVALRAA
ncbi:MAG: type II toxin-antitoxin system VapC family toxin [Alphaproteobacteria bacterium]|nr:type II toxin-antitoxin system VapC family toxin [Alphaproteobacteria bacterium]